MDSDSSCPKIYLVYSSSGSQKTIDQEKQTLPAMSIQMGLFPSGKENVVVLYRPERSSFRRMLDFITEKHIKYVVDLRELPYLSFQDMSRKDVFDAFSSERIKYINVQYVAQREGEFTLDEFFCIASQADNRPRRWVDSVLEPLLEHGPTIVLTDNEPKDDQTADCFMNALEALEIPTELLYSEPQHGT